MQLPADLFVSPSPDWSVSVFGEADALNVLPGGSDLAGSRLAQDRGHQVVSHSPHDALLGVVEKNAVAKVLRRRAAAERIVGQTTWIGAASAPDVKRLATRGRSF